MWSLIIKSIASSWLAGRLKERTSWNGFVLIAIGTAVVIGAPFITWAAYGAIAYGAWQVYQKEIK